eukprot:Em0002g208a
MACCHAQSIDTKEPIIRTSPDLTSTDYFGYSAVLHQTPVATVVLIGAPNGTAPGSAVNNTGLVYVCPVTNPGTCAGLTTFTRSSLATDTLLYDRSNNSASEQKSGQFLGGTIISKRGLVVICGHRYFKPQYTPNGRCFVSNSSLIGFQQYAPCSSSGTASRVTVASGALRTITRLSGTAELGYQGYTVASGHILQKTTEDFLVSVPRLNNMGVVNLVMNSATVTVVSQPLQGTQLSEYYGFSIITADLTGDGYDEVLVGAPYYSPVQNPEAGIVYVYRNNAGSLQFVKQLCGSTENYGRFGHAMTNLGDINGDGLDDVAISAPFASGGGKVFIYNGVVTTTISSTHSQVIQGNALQSTINLFNLTSFGTSLSSGVDIDKNTYNDLAIGAYNSGQVFILRTRPTALVAVSLTANPTLVQLTNGLYPSCNLTGTTYACFNLTACLTYTGNGVSNLLNLTVTIIGDTSNQALGLASRLFIGTNSSISTFVTTVGTTKNIQSCLSLPVYIKNEILDKLNGFTMQMNVSVQDFAPPSQNGNGTLTNLTGYPVLSVQGTSSVQVTSIDRGNCSSGTCIPIPNLAIQFLNISYEVSNGTGQSLVAQQTTNLNLWFNISNSGQNAFATVLTFLVPKSQLYFIRCDPNLAYLSTIQDYSTALFLCTCQVANPLQGGNYSVIAVRLEPTANIDVTQGVIPLMFNVSSQNPENQTTVQDNSVSVQMNITAASGLSVDPIGIARPEQIILSTTTNTTSVNPLGPSILTTFTVRNAGPSTIPLVQLNIYWPLNSSETGSYYYLVPTSLQALTTTFFTQCDTTYLNLIASSVNATQAPSSSGGGNKRRAASLSTSTAQDINKTIDCQLTPSSCVRMQCNISQLTQSQVQITINAALDLRYYTAENIKLTFIPYVNVSIEGNGANYIVQTSSMKSATANIKVLKRTTASSDSQTGRPAWVGWVIGGICVLLILIIVGLIVVKYMALHDSAKAPTGVDSIYANTMTSAASEKLNQDAGLAEGNIVTGDTSQITPRVYVPNTTTGNTSTSSFSTASSKTIRLTSCSSQHKEKEPSLDGALLSAVPSEWESNRGRKVHTTVMAGVNGYKDSSDIVYEQIQDKPTTRLGLGQAAWRGSTQSLQLPAEEERSQFVMNQSRKNYSFCMPSVPASKTLACIKEKRKQVAGSSSNVELGLNLQDLAAKHSDWFPFRVKVIKKKTSDSRWSHIGVGETYNVYSVKENDKTVTFSDSGGGTFTLPSDANIGCSLVYSLEPENFEKCTSTAEYTFKRVSDIIRAQPIPKIVCATRMGTGKSVDSAVMPGEILGVSGVQSDKRCLHVYSYTLECAKVLDWECAGNFTNEPCRRPAAFSTASNSSEQHGNHQLLMIPVTSDIEVAVVKICGKELLELKAQSLRLLHKEDRLKTYMALHDSAKVPTGVDSIYANTMTSAASEKLNKDAGLAEGNIVTGDTSQVAPPTYPRVHVPNATTGNTSTSSSSTASSKTISLTSCSPQHKEKEPSSDGALLSAGPSLVAAIEERFKCKRLSRDSAITQMSVSGDSTGDCDIETLKIKYIEVKEDLEKCQSLLRDYRGALTATQKDVDDLKRNVESINGPISGLR